MGISRITKEYEPNDNMVVAYKVYQKYGNNYYEIYQYQHRKLGKYYKAKSKKVSCPNGAYDSGFHCFVHMKHAYQHFLKLSSRAFYEDYVIVQVHAWDIRTRGIWLGKNTIVSQNIRLIKEITR